MKGKDLLDVASELVYGDRAAQYGDAGKHFRDVADAFYALTKTVIQTSDIPLLMVLIKLSRQEHKRKDDNIIDAMGYLAIMADISEPKQEPAMTWKYREPEPEPEFSDADKLFVAGIINKRNKSVSGTWKCARCGSFTDDENCPVCTIACPICGVTTNVNNKRCLECDAPLKGVQ